MTPVYLHTILFMIFFLFFFFFRWNNLGLGFSRLIKWPNYSHIPSFSFLSFIKIAGLLRDFIWYVYSHDPKLTVFILLNRKQSIYLCIYLFFLLKHKTAHHHLFPPTLGVVGSVTTLYQNSTHSLTHGLTHIVLTPLSPIPSPHRHH